MNLTSEGRFLYHYMQITKEGYNGIKAFGNRPKTTELENEAGQYGWIHCSEKASEVEGSPVKRHL